MPVYPYECPSCGHDFEVTKRVAMIDDEELCDLCDAVATRTIAKTGGFIGASDWDTAHYNPALGKVVKSNAEARQIAKSMGMEEVGNEPVEKIHKHFDNQRAEKQKRTYDDLYSTNVGEITTK